jgi:hypothetical protein
MSALDTVPMPSIDQQRKTAVSTFENTPSGLKQKGGDPKHVDYINKLLSSQQRISQIGRQPVTIVNLNPYTLMVCHPLFDGITVKAVKAGDEFSALVIKDVKYEVDTGLDHNHSPIEHWPIALAEEFINQYRDKGGVFLLKGNLEDNPELANTAEFKAKHAAALDQLYIHAFQMKVSADAEWNRPNRSGRSNIHAQHRMLARILFDAKKIAKLPDWEDALIATDDIQPDCPSCKSELKKGAYMCGTCGRISDPIAAFKDGRISETDVCLERLTRAEVIALGVSAFVAETSDEGPARLKAGKAKPLSQFEINQMAAQAAETKKAEKAAGKAN